MTTAPMETQLTRLTVKRGMSVEVARQRIAAQPSQALKIEAADVVIDNTGTFESTWKQVLAAWQRTIPGEAIELVPAAPAADGVLVVERAGPRQAKEIAELITAISKGRRAMRRPRCFPAGQLPRPKRCPS